jgi:hypothetical protein
MSSYVIEEADFGNVLISAICFVHVAIAEAARLSIKKDAAR